MSENDKISFPEGEEEEFHITDEDIDRELAAMEMDHAASADHNVAAPTDAALAANKSSAGIFSKLKQLKRKHWLMIAIVVLVILFVLLKMMAGHQSSSFDQITPVSAPLSTVKSSTAMSAASSQSDLSKTVLQSPSKTQSDALLPAPTLTVPTTHQEQKTDLSKLGNNESKLLEALDAIQQQNTALRQQVSTLSTRLQGLESSFNQSNQAIEGLSQQVVKIKTNDQSPSVAVPAPPQAVSTDVQYSVEAVVPQRAWLQTADGSTITVMIGDDVPGLGAVVAIDPYSGNVTTSSGSVLKYGNN